LAKTIKNQIIQEDCFSEIKTKGQEIIPYLEELINKDNLLWEPHFGFKAINIETNWIQREPALQQVNNISKIKQLGVLKVPKKSTYNWHVDVYRLACINLLISKNHNSHTLFGKYSNNNYYENFVCDFIELEYKPATFYLFNNKFTHSVVNLDHRDRFLLSLYFEKQLPYKILKEKFKQTSMII
jgi:hypothetical protein